MIKVLFLMENLGGGGAEKVLPNLLKHLDRRKFEITVLTFFTNGINRKRLPEDITYIARKALHFRGITYLVKFLSADFLYNYLVKRVIPHDDFDVVVAYMHGLPTKVAAGAKGKRKISWIHGNMMGGYVPPLRKNFLNRHSMSVCLSKIDAFVGVSQVVCNSFIKYTGISQNVHLIHNTNDVEEINHKASAFSPYEKVQDVIKIITVGHLESVKGNERLLHAAKSLKEDGFAFCITILGEGTQRSRLEAYIQEHDLQDCVKMPGFVDNPYPYVKNADLYVCPSLSEGFSTAVSEAIILGIPVISTRVSGAEEILGANNEYGLVCDNSEEGIYNAMKKMLKNADLRKHYAQKAKERAHFFEPARTVGAVERLIEQVMQKQSTETS